MPDLQKLAKKINRSRKKDLSNFDQIHLTASAVSVLKRLFYNPDCISLQKLEEYENTGLVPLNRLSSTIVTAAPSTIAKYANDHQKLCINQNDLINCFAVDHTEAIKDNRIEKLYSPSYALSHFLLSGKIVKLFNLNNYLFADIKCNINDRYLIFKKVLVPKELLVEKGDRIWHHFGVVISKLESYSTIKQQSDLPYTNFMLKELPNNQIIDFSDKRIFKRDITGRIINEQKELTKKRKIISDPSINKVDTKNSKKIKFIH